jgi:SAM-dependent methyltransferase
MKPPFSLKKLLPEGFRNRYRGRWYIIKQHVINLRGRLLRLIYRPPFPDNSLGVNVHLGCGSINHPHFINVDGSYYPHVHFQRSLTDLSCFATGSVDFLYASHCLEHFPYEYTAAIMAEWFRVLRPDGVVRVAVPDFDALVDIYLESNRDIDSILVYLMGGQGFKYNIHFTQFTRKSLTHALRTAGFRDIRPWVPGQDALSSMNDAASTAVHVGDRRVAISLNLEATK